MSAGVRSSGSRAAVTGLFVTMTPPQPAGTVTTGRTGAVVVGAVVGAVVAITEAGAVVAPETP
jgi:hypothetical protein